MPNDGRKSGFCTPKRCCAMTCGLLILSIVGVLVWYFIFFKSEQEGMASCGDCFCIVQDGNSCPASLKSNYTDELMDLMWKRQTIVNPYELDCDPYTDQSCDTQPVQNETLLELEEQAVCAIHSVDPDAACDTASYTLQTYASREEAETAGGFVTHVGHCGVCSTLQDLAVYAKYPALTTEGKFCASKDSISVEGGLACYRNLGMTDDCAKLWSDAEANTFLDCFKECFLSDITQNEPNNGPAPECKLNDCLQCDEDTSAKLLAQYAGRTRRRSGLLSPVARKCDDLALIEHLTCPETTPFQA